MPWRQSRVVRPTHREQLWSAGLWQRQVWWATAGFHCLGRRTLLAAGFLLLAVICGGCGRSPEPPIQATATDGDGLRPFAVGTPQQAASAVDLPPVAARCSQFVDVAKKVGLGFTYENGEAGASLMVEAIGGGAGWLDVDRDGHWDCYLVQGGDPTVRERSGQPGDQLFQNIAGRAFTDVSSAAGIDQRGYGQGVAVADYDNDGFDDIYVTNVGPNVLLRNMGDGSFVDVTMEAGVGGNCWSSSAAWADLDADGDLDLYVCHYLAYDPLAPIDCRNARGEPRICHPRDIDPVPDACYLNQGNGRFQEAAADLGLVGPGNKALGVAIADFTGDARPDVYVANDTEANFLFVGQPEGGFVESALALGCAVDRNGRTQASMGVAVGDYDADHHDDLYVTHFYDESNTLYHSLGSAGFEDATGLTGLHGLTLPRLGFGTVMADFNADGFMELLIANGHIENFPGNPLLKMRPQLLAWTGHRWQDCSAAAGGFFSEKQVGRGVATADFDNDGDLDAVVVHQNTPLALLENQTSGSHWLAVECVGRQSNRRGIGCRILVDSGNRQLVQQLCGGTSYASSHQPRGSFGLAEDAGPCRVVIQWPSGVRQQFADVPVDQLLTAVEPRQPAGE